MQQVNDFEKMIIQSDTHLLKLYFSINKSEQSRRLNEIKKSPLKKWKITPVDEKALELWDSYTKYKKLMIRTTDTPYCPWKVINANMKTGARLEAMKYI